MKNALHYSHTKTVSLSAAQIARKKRSKKQGKQAGKAVKTPVSRVISPYTLYLQSLAPTGRSGMACMLKVACAFLGWKKAPERCPWAQLSYQQVVSAKAAMLEAGYAINSVNMALAGLKSIARVAFHVGSMPAEQWMRIQSVKAVKGNVLRKGRVLSKTDIQAVLKASTLQNSAVKRIRDRALFLVGCAGGLRCAELIALQIGDLDVQAGCLQILHAKGRKQREIYLSKPTLQALQQWIRVLPDTAPESPLFRQIDRYGGIKTVPLSKSGITNILTTLQRLSGIARFSAHDMRRTFITHLLMRGEDINTVRQLAGHTSVNTTAIYDFRGEHTLRKASQSIRF